MTQHKNFKRREMKQSSIEWLEECLKSHLTNEQQMQFEGLFQQAKEMHKKEIIDAYNNGVYLAMMPSKTSEQYYKNTYENETKQN